MTLYLPMLTAPICAFLCAFVAIKLFKPLAVEVGLVDRPSERKFHDGDIPLVGGIAIFIAVLMASVLCLPDTQELRMYLIASAMMVFIGALDDKYDLRVRVRIIGQLIVASLMIYGVGGYISNLGNILGFGDINLGFLGILFTYLGIIVVINAYNMIDGIDGLIGSLSLNTFVSITILFIMNGNKSYASYPLILATAILPYLVFNLSLFKNKVNAESKKIFMGDAGSMFIGLSVVWLLTMGTQGEQSSFRPVTALWICAIPLMDMLAIVTRRYKSGRSPFKPDRDHLHHILQRIGFSTNSILGVIFSLSVILSSIGIAGEYFKLPEFIMLSAFILLFIIYNIFIKILSNKKSL